MNSDNARKFASEFFGTMFLVMIVVGSGIMGERLANGNEAITLLANTIATGAGLYFLITTFSGISGAHFNPLVTLIETFANKFPRGLVMGYLVSQFSGAIAGAVLANLMFGLSAINAATKIRSGWNIFLSEIIATFGLIVAIRVVSSKKPDSVAAVVACYITAGYWFTSSTSFANPAVTIARSLTNTFTGICYESIPQFLIAQAVGAVIATLFCFWLLRKEMGQP